MATVVFDFDGVFTTISGEQLFKIYPTKDQLMIALRTGKIDAMVNQPAIAAFATIVKNSLNKHKIIINSGNYEEFIIAFIVKYVIGNDLLTEEQFNTVEIRDRADHSELPAASENSVAAKIAMFKDYLKKSPDAQTFIAVDDKQQIIDGYKTANKKYRHNVIAYCSVTPGFVWDDVVERVRKLSMDDASVKKLVLQPPRSKSTPPQGHSRSASVKGDLITDDSSSMLLSELPKQSKSSTSTTPQQRSRSVSLGAAPLEEYVGSLHAVTSPIVSSTSGTSGAFFIASHKMQVSSSKETVLSSSVSQRHMDKDASQSSSGSSVAATESDAEKSCCCIIS